MSALHVSLTSEGSRAITGSPHARSVPSSATSSLLALNVLADGTLVVIYGCHIAKIDPATGNVLAETELPTGDSKPGDTAYNGYDALADGTIIAKSVNRQPGCTEQGFSAFLNCPDPPSAPPSQVTLPEMMGGRLTTTNYEDTDQIYLPGATELYRYTYKAGAFTEDPTWGPVSYLQDGQTAASAMAVIGDYVVGMTNGGAPTSTPMSVFAVSQADSTQISNLQPSPTAMRRTASSRLWRWATPRTTGST